MTSQFYNRYIPPSSKTTVSDDQLRPSKKRKSSTSITTILPSQEKGPITEKVIEDALASDTKTPLSTEQEVVADEKSVPLRSRHHSILSRYEKAKTESAGKPRKISAIKDETTGLRNDHPKIKSHGLSPLPQPAEVEELPSVSMTSALPEWLRSATHVSSASTVPFSSLSINEQGAARLQELGYEKAFAVQAAVLPMLLRGPEKYSGDICISAATGSGKTLAYALPMIESLQGKPMIRLRGLVVVPTRELVSQVKETFDLCSGETGLKAGTAVGSKTLKEEQAALVGRDQRYDPEAYKAEKEKKVDEDEELMDWDFEKRFGQSDEVEILYNHVVEYNSKVDILICTPGRLVEHIQSTKGFTLEHVKWLVIDEADRLLDESFQQWIDIVLPGLEYLPPLDLTRQHFANAFHTLRRREVQKIILSATLTRDISKLMAFKLRRPRLVVVDGQSQKEPECDNELNKSETTERVELPITLEEFGVKVSDSIDKPLHLIQLIEQMSEFRSDRARLKRREAPASSGVEDASSDSSATHSDCDDFSTAPTSVAMSATHGILIFTKTNEHATRLARLVSLLRPTWAPKVATLTKSTASSASQKALRAFRRQKLSILIASDRASRGLDIPELAHVINYDMPSSLTSYIHRVGRTARAGKVGKATTLIADNEARWFWNEIARSGKVGRGTGKKVVRIDRKLEVGEEERKLYQEALDNLREETQAKHK